MSVESEMSYTDMSKHAFVGAKEYLQLAIAHVDGMEGWGGAKANPALVTALVQASALEFLAMMVSHRAAQAVFELSGQVGHVASSIRAGGKK